MNTAVDVRLGKVTDLDRIIYEISSRNLTSAYIAGAPCGMYCTMGARVRGKIPPQSGRATAFAGAAAAGVYTPTEATLRLEGG